MTKKENTNTQVKLTLASDLYQQLVVEAQAQGLKVATYIRLLICQRDLQEDKNNVKIKLKRMSGLL